MPPLNINMKKYITLILLLYACAQSVSQEPTGTVVILSDKVGPVIDLEERKLYRMFMGIQNYESAVLLQSPDGSYTFKAVSRQANDTSVKVHWFPATEEEIKRIRLFIETYDRIQDVPRRSSDNKHGKPSGEMFSMTVHPTYEGFCFRGKPLAECGSFLITEFGVQYLLKRNRSGKAYPYQLNVPYTIGWMKNIGLRNAFGGALGLDVDFSPWHGWFFMGPRYRYWMSQRTSLDIAAYLEVGKNDGNVNIQAVWMVQDLIGLDAGMKFDCGKGFNRIDTTRPFVGVRVGSYPCYVAYSLTTVGIALLMMALSNID
jgi:hypothetical protein